MQSGSACCKISCKRPKFFFFNADSDESFVLWSDLALEPDFLGWPNIASSLFWKFLNFEVILNKNSKLI
jgi:hypothetical protein